jgi:hypothetical protein
MVPPTDPHLIVGTFHLRTEHAPHPGGCLQVGMVEGRPDERRTDLRQRLGRPAEVASHPLLVGERAVGQLDDDPAHLRRAQEGFVPVVAVRAHVHHVVAGVPDQLDRGEQVGDLEGHVVYPCSEPPDEACSEAGVILRLEQFELRPTAVAQVPGGEPPAGGVVG